MGGISENRPISFARRFASPTEAGPVGRHASAGTDWKMNTEVLTYSRSQGVFAGGTLEGAVVQQDDDSTRALYGKNMKFRNILSGKATTPKSADAFMNAVADAGQQARIAEATEDKEVDKFWVSLLEA